MSNTVVWFDSSETGAPVLNNTAGSLDAVLQACLVTGFRTITLDSVTVTANVATATYSAGHGYGTKRVLEIAGAATSSINGRKLITVTGAGTFTFPAPGVADGTIGGTITTKRAPLGWARPLSSGNVSMYARTDVTATGMALRVDDSGTGVASATAARARMVESYSDLSTFANPAPPAGSFSGGGLYWPKGANNSTAKAWLLVGDGLGFYLFTETSGNSLAGGWNVSGMCAFGDISPYRSGDAYHCLIAGADSDTGFSTSAAFGAVTYIGSVATSGMSWLCRPFNGVGPAVQAGMIGISNAAGARRLGGQGPAYPSPVDNGLVLHTPSLIAEVASAFGNPVRGAARGLADPLTGGWTVASLAAVDRTVLTGLSGSTRDYLLVGFNQGGQLGLAAFDVTGPW